MPTKLSKLSLRRAVGHVAKYGDTDVLPHPVESVFLSERKTKIVDELAALDLDTFKPAQGVEIIAPKSRLGFRIVHQLPILETLLLTAAVIEIGGDLEKRKRPIEEFGSFAYRFSKEKGVSLFTKNHTYRDWLEWQRHLVSDLDYSEIVFTDIADFYQRIYLHRLENILDTATRKKGINRFIIKLIKQIRSRQSYGIPVGGAASRLLAEAVLADTDSFLADEDIVFTRFVDDYRIFLRPDQSAYATLASLAEQLATSEGLSLNAQKTKIMPLPEFQAYIDRQLVDVYDAAQQSALDALSHALYFDEEPDEIEIDKVRSLNLLSLLQGEMSSEIWDFGKIRAIFLGLRVTENEDAIQFLTDRLESFLPFGKEPVFCFDVMHSKEKLDSAALAEKIIAELKMGAASSVPTIRVWLLELFVRGCLKINHKELLKISKDETLSNRQNFLIRGLNNDVNFFRKGKTRFEQTNSFEKFPFLLGATCLPKDEFKAWISAIKTNMDRPLNRLFCDWVLGKVGKLADVIATRTNLARE